VGAAQMLASNEQALNSEMYIPFAAQARCYPGGVPGQLLFPFEPVYFIQTPKQIWNVAARSPGAPHPPHRQAFRAHHAVVVRRIDRPLRERRHAGVDTIGLSTKNSYIDNYRTPHTEKLHVVERFTLEPDGKNLTAIATVEDPTRSTADHHEAALVQANGPMRETICAENNRDYFNQGLFAVPEAEKPDF